MASNSISTNGALWNGPICSTCGARYVGQHACLPGYVGKHRKPEPIQPVPMPTWPQTPPTPSPMAGCPCRKENGGSGVCGCVLGGMTITCRA